MKKIQEEQAAALGDGNPLAALLGLASGGGGGAPAAPAPQAAARPAAQRVVRKK
jgi:hypothetical protein